MYPSKLIPINSQAFYSAKHIPSSTKAVYRTRKLRQLNFSSSNDISNISNRNSIKHRVS